MPSSTARHKHSSSQAAQPSLALALQEPVLAACEELTPWIATRSLHDSTLASCAPVEVLSSFSSSCRAKASHTLNASKHLGAFLGRSPKPCPSAALRRCGAGGRCSPALSVPRPRQETRLRASRCSGHLPRTCLSDLFGRALCFLWRLVFLIACPKVRMHCATSQAPLLDKLS